MLRVLFLSGFLTILIAGAVFGARLPNRYACLTFSNFSNNSLTLYDPSHNFFAPETRYRMTVMGWLTPERHSLLMTGYPDDLRHFGLMFQDGTTGERIVVEESLYQATMMYSPSLVGWSSDRRKLAYLWLDANRQQFLTIFSLDDRSKRSVPLAITTSANASVSITSWSSDGQYIILGEMSGFVGFKVLGILNTEQMTLAFAPELPNIERMAWSPDGHIMAAIVGTISSRSQLMLFNPERADEPTLIDLEFQNSAKAISWSPDGSTIALARQGPLYGQLRGGRYQWYFSFFTGEGEVIALDVVGKAQNPPVLDGRSVTSGLDVVPGFWMPDGATWVYLQERNERNHPQVSLVGFHAENGDFETLEANVVSELYLRMFQPVTQNTYMPSDTASAQNDEMLLPRWEEDGIALDYVNYEDETRIALLAGAAEIADIRFVTVQYDQGWDERFVIHWTEQADGQDKTHLTMLDAADGEVLVDLVDIDGIRELNWVSSEWFGFVAMRDGVEGIDMVNLATGEHRRLPVELAPEEIFNAMLSPDGTEAIVMSTDNSSFSSTDRGQVAFYSLEDGASRVIHEQAAPYGLWSPDGSAYAFFREGAGNGLQVIDSSGNVVADTDFQNRTTGGSLALSLYQWSQCEPRSQR